MLPSGPTADGSSVERRPELQARGVGIRSSGAEPRGERTSRPPRPAVGRWRGSPPVEGGAAVITSFCAGGSSDRPEPPCYGPRPKRRSKVDPFVWRICELLDEEPTLSGAACRRRLPRWATREARRSWTPLARAAPALPATAAKLSSAPSTAPVSWPSSTSASRCQRSRLAGPDPSRLPGHLQAALLARFRWRACLLGRPLPRWPVCCSAARA